HPDEEHFFVWILTVAPAAQRTGVGRALLQTALARAAELGVPTYLDTAKPENLPYYGSFGFEPGGPTLLPRGAPLWFMYPRVRWSPDEGRHRARRRGRPGRPAAAHARLLRLLQGRSIRRGVAGTRAGADRRPAEGGPAADRPRREQRRGARLCDGLLAVVDVA